MQFRCGVEAGRDPGARDLLAFDAVLLATGATVPRDLPIPGRELAQRVAYVPQMTAMTFPFSALEVVPLTMIAYAAIDDLRRGRLTPWTQRYKWPIYFFVAVAFWNMVGAGLFGFMINPPIALYYMQGLNTTPVHGHAALFGVYGMLGIGLMLVCLRALAPDLRWNDKWLKFAFWSMNIGLLTMCVGSLLPVGLLQTWASVDQGYWYARSTEFLGTATMQTLRWLRVPGDTIFAAGEFVLVLFVLSLRPRRSSQ